jgi:hypothetical protein
MRRKRFLSAALPIFLGVGAATAAAQTPFAGTWKLNQEKSQLGGDTMKFGPAQDNSIEMVAGGMTYSFRTDGNNYAMPTGNIASWRQTGPDSWTTEYRTTSGKLLSSDHWKLSADGKGLNVVSSGVKASGDLYTDTVDYVRTEGSGESLNGTWKSSSVKLGSPGDLVIEVSGLYALTLKIPASNASCRATLDWKEAPCEGPEVPTGLRIALTRTGPYSMKMVQNLNGKTISSWAFTASDDGKTLTEVGGTPGDPPATMIWEKK